ncbi:EamA family transporter [Nigerium massiliense]|uniref:EamA family transporter n=1 Tax=Nigerium massiliense TaxID=1522317 RepID=UPI000907AD48|nr:EamA family transporter [Nigerium massiliense]
MRRPTLPPIPPVALVLVAIASVQLGSSVAKSLFGRAEPWTIAWLRLLAAAVVLTLVARPRLRGRSAGEWVPVLGYGACMTGMNIAFYLAISRIPVGMAVTVEFLGPLAVAVLGSRKVTDLVWTALAATGVVLLGFTPGQLDWTGVGLAALAGAFWGGYILLAGPTGRSWDGVTGVTLASWVGAVTLAPVALGTAAATGGGALADPGIWLAGALVGLLSSVIPYGLEMVALRSIRPGLFGILMSMEPAVAAFFAFLVLREELGPVELLAMACVIVASIGSSRADRSRAGQAAS